MNLSNCTIVQIVEVKRRLLLKKSVMRVVESSNRKSYKPQKLVFHANSTPFMALRLFAKTASPKNILVTVCYAMSDLQNRTATIASIVFNRKQTDSKSAKVAAMTFSRLITTCTAICVGLNAGAGEAKSEMVRRSVRRA
jgi:hypothetical protein